MAIVILAAGASMRMGSPKQLLNWGRNSLLGHAITTCKKSLAKDIIVVLGANCDTIASGIKETDVSVVINKEWKQGLGRSIASAVQFILDSKKKVTGLLIILADQPFVTTDYLDKMVSEFNSGSSKIIATTYDSDITGVPVLFDVSYFKELSQLSGDAGAKSLIKKYQNQLKVLIPKFQNWDIDTKEDYAKLKRRYFS